MDKEFISNKCTKDVHNFFCYGVSLGELDLLINVLLFYTGPGLRFDSVQRLGVLLSLLVLCAGGASSSCLVIARLFLVFFEYVVIQRKSLIAMAFRRLVHQ